MRKDKYKWQVGDILYEASMSYKKVFSHEITDIWIEDYISGPKTIARLITLDAKTGDTLWMTTKFLSDIVHYHNTREEAEAALAEMLARKD